MAASDKILSQHRRQLGEFEAVDFVDEAAIDKLRAQLDVDVPLDLRWTWEYGSEVEELRNLYERGKKGQWNAETDIDWDIPFPRDEWFMPKVGALLLPSLLSDAGVAVSTRVMTACIDGPANGASPASIS